MGHGAGADSLAAINIAAPYVAMLLSTGILFIILNVVLVGYMQSVEQSARPTEDAHKVLYLTSSAHNDDLDVLRTFCGLKL